VETTTTQPVTTTTQPAQSLAGCFVDLAREVGWPEATLQHLEFIVHRESDCDPTAFADRPSTLDLSRGLLQINAYGSLDAGVRRLCGIDPATLFDPRVNLACGLSLYDSMGWAPWGG
jgi:hypothetical protein